MIHHKNAWICTARLKIHPPGLWYTVKNAWICTARLMIHCKNVWICAADFSFKKLGHHILAARWPMCRKRRKRRNTPTCRVLRCFVTFSQWGGPDPRGAGDGKTVSFWQPVSFFLGLASFCCHIYMQFGLCFSSFKSVNSNLTWIYAHMLIVAALIVVTIRN